MAEQMLNTKEAGKVLGLSAKTLQNNRSLGTGAVISYVKLGGAVRYRLSDLERYIKENTFNHTGESKELRNEK